MKKTNKSMIDELRDYLEKTPREQLDKDWESLKEWNNVGPNVFDYLNEISKQKKF